MPRPAHPVRHAPSRPVGGLGAMIFATGALVISLVACGGDDDDRADGSDDVTDIVLREPDRSELDSSKPEVQIPDALPRELIITDLTDGTGPAAAAGDTVFVNYVGVRSADGQEFDSNYDNPIPFAVRLGDGSVIDGWEQGLIGATTAMRRRLDIPAELAYGDNAVGGVIQAGDALTFVIDVRAVVPAVNAADAPDDLDLTPSIGRESVEISEVRIGEGPPLDQGDTGIFHLLLYRGSDLELILNTWDLGSPEQIAIIDGATLTGLVEGFTTMRVGGVRIVSIPSEAAWDSAGNEMLGIEPDEDIVLVAELFGRL